MKVSTVATVVVSSNRDNAVYSFTAILGGPVSEFPIPSAPLTVTTFPGMSLLSGPAEALIPVRDLRATFFVDSLSDIETLVSGLGWSKEGSLGECSLLARDPDGNLLEFVERDEAR
jgi:hypothetical protein